MDHSFIFSDNIILWLNKKIPLRRFALRFFAMLVCAPIWNQSSLRPLQWFKCTNLKVKDDQRPPWAQHLSPLPPCTILDTWFEESSHLPRCADSASLVFPLRVYLSSPSPPQSSVMQGAVIFKDKSAGVYTTFVVQFTGWNSPWNYFDTNCPVSMLQLKV